VKKTEKQSSPFWDNVRGSIEGRHGEEFGSPPPAFWLDDMMAMMKLFSHHLLELSWNSPNQIYQKIHCIHHIKPQSQRLIK
jgi:hypothetical protein